MRVVSFKDYRSILRTPYADQQELPELKSQVVTLTRPDGPLKDARRLIVKFVQGYNFDVHEELANLGIAPKGEMKQLTGWQAIVMEDLEEQEFRVLKPEEVTSEKEKEEIISKLVELIKLMHHQKIVHGDIRPPSVMWKRKKGDVQLKLVDFDWAGHVGKARNQTLLSDEVISVQCAEVGGAIAEEHDIDMVKGLSHQSKQ